MSPLSTEEAKSLLNTLSNWKIVSGELVKTLQFKTSLLPVIYISTIMW